MSETNNLPPVRSVPVRNDPVPGRDGTVPRRDGTVPVRNGTIPVRNDPVPDRTDKTVLSARGLVKRFGRVVALDGADFDLRPGEVLAVIGDNGAGKSTLIKALTGALSPERGEIFMDEQPVAFRSPLDARLAGIETGSEEPGTQGAVAIPGGCSSRALRSPGFPGSSYARPGMTTDAISGSARRRRRPGRYGPRTAGRPCRRRRR